MHARLRAMMPAVKTILAGLGVGGALPLAVTVHDQWQAHIDRNRIMNRVIHSAFHAAKPEVEIPRKHVQAQISGLLDLADRSPLLIWGNHQSGKSFAVFKACREAGFHQGIVHVKLDSDKEVAGERLRQQLGAPGHVEVEEALKQAAKTLGRVPIIILEIARQVSEMKVLASCSGLAKMLGYDAELAKVIVLACSASMALSFDADAREVRCQIASLNEEECEQPEAGAFFAERVPLFGMLPQAQQFLQHHGGDAAVEHKAELLHLSGGNVGKLEELAKNLKTQPIEQVRQEALGEQEQEILRFLGIDAHGGFDGTKAAKEVARCVADAPFHQCVRSKDFMARFTSKHLAQAVKAQGGHCIYVKATTKADERFCAASPSVHALLREMAPALETDEKPKQAQTGGLWF
ncbi:unnamed protein product [Symbiodinium pilosum]|uniref:Uncharacterized protein n=1 Tax=Symbiodinium pilosum TaxID=2952 RepID=A0A812TC96_SYMPI|nr:unnamed protein product [Symbiodinium pilosum]